MNQGRHTNPNRTAPVTEVKRRRKRRSRSLALILSLVLVLCVAGGATLAYFATQSDTNAAGFTAGSVSCSVSGGTVVNNSNVAVKVRAAVVVNWVDDQGNIRGIAPGKDTDYSITPGTGWSLNTADGYYYYNSEVPVGGSTEAVCTVTLKPGVTVPDGYRLQTVILAEAIQANGSTGTDSAAQDAWE